MKAQHRHELQTNELAVWLEKKIEQVKPYTQAIIGVLVAAAVLFGVYMYLKQMDRGAEQAASDQLIGAMNSTDPLKDLQTTIEDHPGTQQAIVAQLLLGEQLLREGTNQLYTNKPVGKDNINKAADAFSAVEALAKDRMLRAWALFGLGRAHESLGQLDRARDDFKQLKADYPSGSLSDDAQAHLDNLDKQSTKEFYDWFATQDPRPLPMQQEPGRPGEKPIFDLSDPAQMPTGSPDLNLPSSFDGSSTPSSTPSSTTPPPLDSSDAPTSSPPADEPPPTTAPPATTPMETQPGNADAPAADAPATEEREPAAPAK